MAGGLGSYIGRTYGNWFNSGGGTGAWKLTDIKYFRSLGKWGSQITATGGNQTPSSGLEPGNGYTYHTFTSPGNLTVTSGGNIEILLVGGGGGPGISGGGGGGAGGVVYVTDMSIGPGSYPVTIGQGGPGFTFPDPGYTPQPGTDTTFSTNPSPVYLIAKGGGAGTPMGGTDAPGGSGGGGARTNTPGGTGTQPTQNPGFSNGTINQYGNPGGASAAGFYPGGGAGGGGGGGASQAGTPSPGPGSGSDGGDGVLIAPGSPQPGFYGPIIGVPALAPLNGYFGGGGGGGNDGYISPGGLGGGGDGGRGAPNFPPNITGGAGVTNSGGGAGGCGSGPGTTGSGQAGGPGIVVIRYIT